MSAWVSPPQESVSHIVQVAAIIAHAASTALPPFWKVIAPAVAASGFPVIASHFRAWSGGLLVAAGRTAMVAATIAAAAGTPRAIRARRAFVIRMSGSLSQPAVDSRPMRFLRAPLAPALLLVFL